MFFSNSLNKLFNKWLNVMAKLSKSSSTGFVVYYKTSAYTTVNSIEDLQYVYVLRVTQRKNISARSFLCPDGALCPSWNILSNNQGDLMAPGRTLLQSRQNQYSRKSGNFFSFPLFQDQVGWNFSQHAVAPAFNEVPQNRDSEGWITMKTTGRFMPSSCSQLDITFN